jgi:hypothetical protein
MLAVLLSCGLEAYNYLAPVPASDIEVEMNTRAVLRLPGSGSDGYGSYFQYFTIFYRIYISGVLESGKPQASSEGYSALNPALWSDYTAIAPSTDTNSTTANTAIGSLFTNRKYYELALEGSSITSVLSSSVQGATIQLDFPTDGTLRPTLTIRGSPDRVYTLFRSTGDMQFTPVPDRYFFNTPELYASANVVAAKNADVADRGGIPASPRYTYVAMYIAALGKDYLTNFYSTPAFIGIFRLPERSGG